MKVTEGGTLFNQLSTDYLQALRDIAARYAVTEVCEVVLSDPRFSTWSASSHPSKHHYGDGGLLQHTLEVVTLCLQTADCYSQDAIDRQWLVVAAIFHDSGKMWDYDQIEQRNINEPQLWVSTPHKNLIHHITRSVNIWRAAAMQQRFAETDIDAVTHAILAHHGRREWGSPVEPQTPIAWVLHCCDQMSARLHDWDKVNDAGQ